jgi:glycosyltransferase involved in cell wall biosynthesis
MTKRVLIIGYVWPEPRSSAAGSRMLQLIELFLQQNWQVTFGSAALLSDQRADLTALGVSEKTLALNCSSFNDFIAELQPDIVLFDRFFTEEQFGWRVEAACPNALRILDTEDLHSLRHARELLVKAAQQKCTTEAEKYSLQLLADDDSAAITFMHTDATTLREIAAIFRCDLSLMISTREIEFLQQYFSVPAELLFYCPLTVNTLEQNLPAFNERKHFISIGNFRHAPNWDAVLCLKHSIWPLIRTQLPRAELHIYGAYMPPKASALHNPKQGFYLRGWAEDAQAVMAQARVCLAPLRFGAGVKGKLLEAMSCATPNVTSPLGAEAMHGDQPWGGAITRDSQSFANAAVALHEDQQAWEDAQVLSQAILHRSFSGKLVQTGLIDKLNQLFKNLVQHRQQNFIGQMLRHHSHKSTQYMSQWIEAKNRL